MPTSPDIFVPLVYSNTLEFLGPISGDEASKAMCFRSGTGEFDSSAGDFYVLATDGIAEEGTWDTELTSDGIYAVEVSAEDVGGNLSKVTAIVLVNI